MSNSESASSDRRRPSWPGAWPSRAGSSRSSPGAAGRQDHAGRSRCAEAGLPHGRSPAPTSRRCAGPSGSRQQWEAARLLRATPAGGRGAGPRRGAEDPRLVRDGQTPVGRGHARPAPAQGRAARLGAAPDPARAVREPRRSLRGRCICRTGRSPRCARPSAGRSSSTSSSAAIRAPRRSSASRARWARYVLDSLIETTIARDVLLLTRVDKPALLRRLFELGLPLLGAGAVLHQDARAAPGRGQHDHAGALPRPARRGAGMLTRPAEVRRQAPCASAARAPSSRC